MAEVPSLAGQPETFLTLQMILFRGRIRRFEPMNAAMRGIRDAEAEALARFAAAPPPPAPEGARDAQRAVRGRALSAGHRCGVCHLADHAGQNQVPRLSGQREDHLLHSMRDYRAGARHGTDVSMQAVPYGLSERDLADLAHCPATVPVGR